MKADIRIEWRDTKTGQTGVFEDPRLPVHWDEDDREWNLFWWSDGNAACDCNREASFLGIDSAERECGDSRFIIEKFWVKPEGAADWELLPYKEKAA